ncbi:pre-mRNA cleavage complex 2 protein Pcf11 [Pycnococcus provasolii]
MASTPSDTAELVEAYAEHLSELTTILARDIRLLTDIARENGSQAAHALVPVLVQAITAAPATQILPKIYVVDSILKNVKDEVGQTYRTLLAPVIADAVVQAYRRCLADNASPTIKAKLDKVRKTWAEQQLVPASELAKMEAAAAAPALQGASPWAAPAPGVGYPPTYNVMAQQHQPQQPQHQQQQQHITHNAAAPVASLLSNLLVQGVIGPGTAAQAATTAVAQPHHQRDPSVTTATITTTTTAPKRESAEATLAKLAAFDETSMKERHDWAVDSLYFDQAHQCPETGRRFRTREALRRHNEALQRKKKRKEEREEEAVLVSSSRGTRPWYLTAPAWVQSTRIAPLEAEIPGGDSAGDGSGDGVDAASRKRGAATPPPPPITTDEYPDGVCALSGERLEKVWSDEREAWVYVDAVRLPDGTVAHRRAAGTPEDGDAEEGGGGGGGGGPRRSVRQRVV